MKLFYTLKTNQTNRKTHYVIMFNVNKNGQRRIANINFEFSRF